MLAFIASATSAASLLRTNAAFAIAFSNLFGAGMLVPLQSLIPIKASPKARRNLMACHLDWYMLAFAQLGAAAIISGELPASDGSDEMLLAAKLLVFSGWCNPLAYLFRAFGVDGFDLNPAKGPLQFAVASFGGLSVAAVFAGWGIIVRALLVKHSVI